MTRSEAKKRIIEYFKKNEIIYNETFEELEGRAGAGEIP